jgi:IS30 family transposase
MGYKHLGLEERITSLLRKDWSPEQIVGRLRVTGEISLDHETIYQYILADKQAGGDLYKHLRHQNKTDRKRYGHPRNRTGIPNRVDMMSARKSPASVAVLVTGRQTPSLAKIIKVVS